jgi:hypothetical protein
MRKMLALLWLLVAGCRLLPAATTYVLIGEGQSLSLGNYGCNAISTTQYGSNQALSGSSLVPLTESAALNGGCQNYFNTSATWSSSVTYSPYAMANDGGTYYTNQSASTTTANPTGGAPWVAVSTSSGGSLSGATAESPLSSAANNASTLASGFTLIANNFGTSGVPLSSWGDASKVSSIASAVSTIKTLVSPNTVVVVGVIVTAGESDYANQGAAGSMASCSYVAGTTAYYANSICFQQSIQSALQSVTGQSAPVPIIYSQMSSVNAAYTDNQTCPDGMATSCIETYPVTSTATHVPIAQYQLARDSANLAVCGTTGYPACGTFYMTGPKYHLDYGTNQGFHLSALGYNLIGAEYGGVLACVFQANLSTSNSCGGVMPETPIYYSGNTVTLNVRTPNGLSLDQLSNSTYAAGAAGAWSIGQIPLPYYGSTAAQKSNGGFQFFQTVSGSPQEIQVTGVSISGNTITLTLASAPTGTNLQLAYGFEGLHYAPTPTYTCQWSASTCDGISATQYASGTPHGVIRTVLDTTYGSGTGNDLNGNPVYHWMPHFIENVSPAAGRATVSGGVCAGCRF